MPELPTTPLQRGSRSRRAQPGAGASLLSRKRLRLALPIAAGLVLLTVFAVALVFNAVVGRHNRVKDAVARMAGAPSYTASGVDVTSGVGGPRQVREEFRFIAPDHIYSHYVVSEGQSSAASLFPTAASVCRDQEVIVLSTTRYMRCRDPGQDGAWQVGNADISLFTTLQFRPWERLAWCSNIREQDGEGEAGGAASQVFQCDVPAQREADAYWPPDRLSSRSAKENEAREGFLANGSVQLTVWVRRQDGYIGRFQMKKVSPVSGGSTTQSLDYTYSGFGQVPAISPPDTMGEPPATPTPSPTATPARAPSPAPSAAPARPKTAVIGGVTFRLEVADTEETRRLGLSNRESLASDAGMLFVFAQPGYWSFWMKDVSFALDLLYLDEDGKIISIHTMPPEPGVPDFQLRRYDALLPAKYALEINGGLADALGLRPGMAVEMR